jgi:hypothetical protein
MCMYCNQTAIVRSLYVLFLYLLYVLCTQTLSYISVQGSTTTGLPGSNNDV